MLIILAVVRLPTLSPVISLLTNWWIAAYIKEHLHGVKTDRTAGVTGL